jgi:hypothetical protein
MSPLYSPLARTLAAGVFLMLSPFGQISASTMPDKLPADVAAFAHLRNACDNWRAQSSTDATKMLEIADGVCRKCVGKDAQLSALRKQYAAQADIAQTLSAYPSPIEVMPARQSVKRCLPVHYQLIRHRNAHPGQLSNAN